jgi:hypothetical protein
MQPRLKFGSNKALRLQGSYIFTNVSSITQEIFVWEKVVKISFFYINVRQVYIVKKVKFVTIFKVLELSNKPERR